MQFSCTIVKYSCTLDKYSCLIGTWVHKRPNSHHGKSGRWYGQLRATYFNLQFFQCIHKATHIDSLQCILYHQNFDDPAVYSTCPFMVNTKSLTTCGQHYNLSVSFPGLTHFTFNCIHNNTQKWKSSKRKNKKAGKDWSHHVNDVRWIGGGEKPNCKNTGSSICVLLQF